MVEAEIVKAEQAIERYLLAFEAGTLPEDQCGARIRNLGAKTAELRDRRAQLTGALDASVPQPPTAEELDALRVDLSQGLQTGTDADRKALMQKLVNEIRVEGRDHIKPTFKVPCGTALGQVRTLYGTVPAAGFEPAAFCSGGRRSLP